MFVDRRKENYDELLMLASDSRASRIRTFRWTTTFVVATFLGTAAYVGAINQEMHDLRQKATEAEEGLGDANEELGHLRAELKALYRYQDLYADIAPATTISKALGDLAFVVRPTPAPDHDHAGVSTVERTINSLVWVVDGSRRFPMTSGDILWVPEGRFWVQMEAGADKPSVVRIYKDGSPTGQTGASTEVDLRAQPDNSVRVEVDTMEDRGTANCIKLTWHPQSSRSAFRNMDEYIDIEVLFYTNSQCPNPHPSDG